MPFDKTPIVRCLDDGVTFQLVEDLCFTDAVTGGKSWIVPGGFRTDFASIPAIVSWAVSKLGAYTLAAIVHDLLCEGLNDYHREMRRYIAAVHGLPGSMWPPKPERPLVDAVDSDAVLYRIAREYGTDVVTASLVWVGIRWGALFNPARRKGWLRTAPAVLALSTLYAPVLLPASLLALLGRGILRVARFVTRSF